jgi:hypothetical protein
MVLVVTPEEESKFRELNRLRMIKYRDQKRKRKYAPREQTRKTAINSSKDSSEAKKE